MFNWQNILKNKFSSKMRIRKSFLNLKKFDKFNLKVIEMQNLYTINNYILN